MILLSYGTRPEWIKIKPIVEKLKVPHKILFTGQHEDLVNERYDEKLTFPECENRLDAAFAAVASSKGLFDGIDYVMVQGDTASAFAIAMAAYHRRIKIIHLEAGLRSFNLDHPYPEEFYRKTITTIADVHLCPTFDNCNNVLKDRVKSKKVIAQVVGNTVCDNLVGLESEYGDEVLVTLHRRENHESIPQWFMALDAVAQMNPETKFTLPIHPNPNVSKYQHLLKHVDVVDPMPYDEFIERMSKCKFVISDSGGIQEESAVLGKRCLVCRQHTERIEGVGSFSTMCRKPEDLILRAQELINNPIPKGAKCPYGDGHASDKIIKIIDGLYEDV